MFRVAWLLAGAVIGYIASGYVEGLMDDERKEDSGSSKQAVEEL